MSHAGLAVGTIAIMAINLVAGSVVAWSRRDWTPFALIVGGYAAFFAVCFASSAIQQRRRRRRRARRQPLP
jgi:hypothetical protein